MASKGNTSLFKLVQSQKFSLSNFPSKKTYFGEEKRFPQHFDQGCTRPTSFNRGKTQLHKIETIIETIPKNLVVGIGGKKLADPQALETSKLSLAPSH